MQLGTRWAVGGEVPPRVADILLAANRGVEAELAGLDTPSWRWTRPWLAGRPIAELDDGTRLRLTADGTVVLRDRLD